MTDDGRSGTGAGAGAGAASALIERLTRDGIAVLSDALPTAWADELHADFDSLYEDAASRAGGLVPRGPNRYYFAVHPERLRGFVPLMQHRLIAEVCASVLGDDYQLVEVGFDVPFPGARAQPWHRDFPVPEETRVSGRLSSLTLNAACVDVAPEMGPLEFAPGTHREPGSDLTDGMYVPPARATRYDALGRSQLPRRGEVSIRTGLMIHRGTPNRSDRPRPTLIVGLIGARYPTHAEHALSMTTLHFDGLPQTIRDHLRRCEIVSELQPIVQDYVLDGLLAEE